MTSQALQLIDDGEVLRGGAHGAHVCFTGRAGGVSAAPYDSLNLGLNTDDDPGAVAENRRLAEARTSTDAPRRFVTGTQVHETAVALHLDGHGDPDVAGVDAHVTDRSDVALGVLTADCVPIALLAPWGIGAAHAGWRGLAGGIVGGTVDDLLTLPDAAPNAADVVAFVGPCAGPCCYEVGEEVHAAFAGWPRGRATDRTIDLAQMAEAALRAAGVGEVVQADRCTICDARYFSHRASGGTTGRQAGIVWRDA